MPLYSILYIVVFQLEEFNDQHLKIPLTHQNDQLVILWPPHSIQHLSLMKLCLPSRSLPNSTNSNRPIPSHELYIRRSNCFLTVTPFRHQLRLNHPIYTCLRASIFFICSCTLSHMLWLLHLLRDMKHQNRIIIYHHGYSFLRLRFYHEAKCPSEELLSSPILYQQTYIGANLVEWMWGGVSVDKATLIQFFAFHIILPFIIWALAPVHLWILHETGCNKPSGIIPDSDKISLHPYYTITDILGLLFLTLILIPLALFSPDLLGDPEDYTLPIP